MVAEAAKSFGHRATETLGEFRYETIDSARRFPTLPQLKSSHHRMMIAQIELVDAQR